MCSRDKKQAIEELRRKLNRLIARNAPFDEVYEISSRLDGLISESYREKQYENKENIRIHKGCGVHISFDSLII